MANLKNSYIRMPITVITNIIQVKIRWVKSPSDMVINTDTEQLVNTLKEMYRVQASIPANAKIRFMYSGR
jgi:hypothetical protein